MLILETNKINVFLSHLQLYNCTHCEFPPRFPSTLTINAAVEDPSKIGDICQLCWRQKKLFTVAKYLSFLTFTYWREALIVTKLLSPAIPGLGCKIQARTSDDSHNQDAIFYGAE